MINFLISLLLKQPMEAERIFLLKDKKTLNIAETKKKLNDFLNMAEASAGREWAYGGSSKKIIVEELLEDNSNKDKGISDYKFLCFNGKPIYVVYDKNTISDHKRNFYDVNCNYVKKDRIVHVLKTV